MERKKGKLPEPYETLVRKAEADVARQRKEKGLVPIKPRGTIKFNGNKK